MLNRITVIGRLVRDPELNYTSNGIPVSNFTLAVERNYENKQGEREVDYIKTVTWRGLAETCAEHLGKGRLVAISGRLQIRKNKANDRTYINPEVYAEQVQFLDYDNDNNKRKNSQTNSKAGSQGQPKQENKNQQNNGQKANYYEEDFDVPF